MGKELEMRNGDVVDADDPATETVECENCGNQRYTFEACHHCGNKHWRDDDAA